MRPLLRSARRAVVDTAGKWRELVVAPRWGRYKAVTELAERWTTTDVPEVDALLASKNATSDFVAGEGLVGDRDLDLVIEGDAQGGRTLLAVLPVGCEPLGPTVDEERQRSLELDRLRGGEPPVDLMAHRVFSLDSSLVGELRFRLLAASAHLLREAEARGFAQAVLVLHEFRSPLTPPQVLADQLRDIDSYLLKLTHRGASTAPGTLLSTLPNGTKVTLFVGRAVVLK
jgi:hypothetical protein